MTRFRSEDVGTVVRRLVTTLAVAMLVVLSSTAPAASTLPNEDVCAGIGTMSVGARMVYTGLGPAVDAAWAMSWSVGVCAGLTPIATMTGAITGWCDYATGTGVTYGGHQFAFLVAGQKIVFTGGVTGEANFIPDEINGQSCFPPGAVAFFVNGAAVFHECLVTNTFGTLPGTDFEHHYYVCA